MLKNKKISALFFASILIFQIINPLHVLADNENSNNKTKEIFIAIPGSNYFKIDGNISKNSKVVLNNFKVEKSEKRFNYIAIEKQFESQIDNIIKNNNIGSVKHKKTSIKNNNFNIFLLETVNKEKEEKEFYILTSLIYNYRITEELLLFNVKIDKLEDKKKMQEKLNDYLKVLLNIEADYELLPKTFREKVFKNKQNNYDYYKKNRDNFKIMIR